jgi:hypothetical protein
MDYSDAYIKAFYALRDTYRYANDRDFASAEQHAADLLLAAKVLLADIQDKK